MVRPCLTVVKADLPAFFHGLVQQVDGVEQLAVVQPVVGQGGDVLHPGLEVPAGKSFQLFRQFPALAVGNVLGEQQTVNEEPQFSISEFPIQVPVGKEGFFLTVGLYPYRLAAPHVITQVDQIQEVSADGLPVCLHVILPLQNLSDLFLRELVVLIGVALKNVQNVKDQELFRLGVHGITSWFHGIRTGGEKIGHKWEYPYYNTRKGACH